MPSTHPRARAAAVRTAIATAALAACSAGQAIELDTGNPDWAVRRDNTVKASTLYRTQGADPSLVNSFRQLVPGVAASAFPQALNFNAGDDNFRNRGFVSKRIDLLSEVDAVWRKNFGLRVSAAAWYDASYQGDSAAADPVNGQAPSNAFPEATRNLAGKKAEVLDAFVFGGWDLGEGRKLTTRFGRHALQYGESLFFGDNGIARAQGPIDIFKLMSSPNAQFKEIIRPVPQVSAQLQLSPDVSVGGYYQFRWEADRLAPAGSYFSTANIPWGSRQPEAVNIPGVGNFLLAAGADQKPRNSGQFGLQLKWRLDETDLGFYAAQYHDKSGQLYGSINPAGPLSPFGTLPGTWFYNFPQDVKTVGASFSRTFGDFNVAGEASVRDGMPLWSHNMIYAGGVGAPQPAPATGKTAHANLSTLATFGPSVIARESSLLAEVAWNRVMSLRDPNGSLDAGRTREATALQVLFTPSYRQALPGVDLNVPVGVRYAVDGNSAVTGAGWGARGTGSANIGIEGNYLGVWQFAATYTRFLGKATPFVDYAPLLTGGQAVYGSGNPLADRHFIALSLRRTF